VTGGAGQVEVRASRLLRWYPRGWRDRYGEEFAEVLIADLEERPRSWRRTTDVAVSGLGARLSTAGLGGGPVGRPQAALATVLAAIVGFGCLGLSVWSQLAVLTSQAPPDSAASTFATPIITVGVLYLAVLAVLATAPVAAAAARAIAAGGARHLLGPIAALGVCLAVVVLGGHHIASLWSSAGGHGQPAAPSRPGPSGAARLGWAETLSLTTYWAHPAAMRALPAAELVWMVASPAALVVGVAATVTILRRLALSAATLAFEATLASAAALGMVVVLAAAGWWVIAAHDDPEGLFRTGSLDLLVIAGMATALVAASAANQRILASNQH
jgi:hypothetical protein